MAKRNVVDFKIINLSEEKFQELKAAGQIDPNALYATPDTTKERLDVLEDRATSLATKTELLENDNGVLKWDDKEVLTNTSANATSGAFGLGTKEDGASLELWSLSSPILSGVFLLMAGRGNNSATLQGYPNGTLKWNGINMSAMGLPSDKYIDLTLGATGSSYKAPADGYLVIRKTATAANQYVYMKSGEIFISTHATSNDSVLEMYVPVQGGKSCVVSYNAGGSTGVFRFVYAEGAKYLA